MTLSISALSVIEGLSENDERRPNRARMHDLFLPAYRRNGRSAVRIRASFDIGELIDDGEPTTTDEDE